MKHQLNLYVCRKLPEGGIVRWRTLTMRERILRKLLGEKRRLMIVIPGHSVETMEIKEIEEGGTDHESQQAADGCGE
jgi:hypothetical protein